MSINPSFHELVFGETKKTWQDRQDLLFPPVRENFIYLVFPFYSEMTKFIREMDIETQEGGTSDFADMTDLSDIQLYRMIPNHPKRYILVENLQGKEKFPEYMLKWKLGNNGR